MTTPRDTRKKELMAELEAIREIEAKERDRNLFHRLVSILDAGDAIIKVTQHTRTSCSDDNPVNGYTTAGRGGSVRCKKCAFMDAYAAWKANRDWLVAIESGEAIEEQLGFYGIGIELEIMTESED